MITSVLLACSATAQVLSVDHGCLSVLLSCRWVVAAFVYYGLVQLVPQLEFVAGEHKKCTNGHLTIPVRP